MYPKYKVLVHFQCNCAVEMLLQKHIYERRFYSHSSSHDTCNKKYVDLVYPNTVQVLGHTGMDGGMRGLKVSSPKSTTI